MFLRILTSIIYTIAISHNLHGPGLYGYYVNYTELCVLIISSTTISVKYSITRKRFFFNLFILLLNK